ncbi:MAG: hypothetical protein IPM39_24390 [Chloroflexi bacterium]|nr:hypothetical protein [Chloroflexota bacterium]
MMEKHALNSVIPAQAEIAMREYGKGMMENLGAISNVIPAQAGIHMRGNDGTREA